MKVIKSEMVSKVETNRFKSASALATYLAELETDVVVVDEDTEMLLILVDKGDEFIVYDLINGGSETYVWWSDLASDLFDEYEYKDNYKSVEAILTYKYL